MELLNRYIETDHSPEYDQANQHLAVEGYARIQIYRESCAKCGAVRIDSQID